MRAPVWLLTILLTALLAYLGWVGTSVISDGNRLSAQEQLTEGIGEQLNRVEHKMDRMDRRLERWMERAR